MLTPEYLMSAADGVVEIYASVEQDIANDIARRIVKTGYFTDTASWQYRKAKEFGYFQGDVKKIIAQASGKSESEIARLMNEAGLLTLAKDDKIYKAAGLNPLPLKESPALQAMLLQGRDNTMRLIGNFTKTTATMSTTAYNSILDRTYIQILTGAFDPTTAIKRTITDVATKGISSIAYPSGVSQSIESSVRRAVTTGLNQTAAKLQLERAEEMDCELVEVTSHAGARPSHAVWQGQIYCIKGYHRQYGDFYDETGYGSGEGLCGWNCYHSFYPYFEGLSLPSFSHDPSAEYGRDNDEDYELQQKQRYYERQIRAAKKECSTYNAAMEAAENDALRDELYKQFQSSSVKLKNREAKLQGFLKETGRTRESNREWTAGWNRSVSQKASWANKKAK